MGLSADEIAACREAFAKFDKDGSGTIDTNELKATLQAMGQNPTEEELFQMIAQVRRAARKAGGGARAPPDAAHARKHTTHRWTTTRPGRLSSRSF